MQMNGIEFQRGISLPEFLHSYGQAAQCAVAVKQACWLDGFRCSQFACSANYLAGQGARKFYQYCDCQDQGLKRANTLGSG